MKDVIKSVLTETFEGIEEGSPSRFVESRAETGIFGTLRSINASQASVDINGTTIAAHAHHTMYHTDVCCNNLEGKDQDVNWHVSWEISKVNEEEWFEIKRGIETQYHRLLALIDESAFETFDRHVIQGSLSHSAYHLGAMRQMIKGVSR
ncbi:hypothetical protein [Salinicoccus albus]|uniref:hypothetical protein n=1 Tax=Salinicoccus albus TaxID=418756 RepID=UPI00037C8A35|nr:hypothetical protein [Salinicoccus albus]